VSVLSKPGSLILLTRPHNGLIAAASVLVGAFLANGVLVPESMTAAAMTFFVCSGAYVMNDIYDLGADRINRPLRPLASGRIGRQEAPVLVILLWAVGAGFALLSGWEAGLFFAIWVCLLWLYSWRIKARGWVGNVVVSAVASSGFILGSLVSGRAEAGVVPFVIAFLFHFPREIAKGIADLRGDMPAGVGTLAVKLGERKALTVLVWLVCAAAAASVLPAITGLYGVLYLMPVLVVVWPILAACLWLLIRARGRGVHLSSAGGSVATLLKVAMPAGLVAFFLAGV
jgi:geranylgeranylglycerol-phosphate geranylgeranyltransferase